MPASEPAGPRFFRFMVSACRAPVSLREGECRLCAILQHCLALALSLMANFERSGVKEEESEMFRWPFERWMEDPDALAIQESCCAGSGLFPQAD